jgi:hypothetical protein
LSIYDVVNAQFLSRAFLGKIGVLVFGEVGAQQDVADALVVTPPRPLKLREVCPRGCVE